MAGLFPTESGRLGGIWGMPLQLLALVVFLLGAGAVPFPFATCGLQKAFGTFPLTWEIIGGRRVLE